MGEENLVILWQRRYVGEGKCRVWKALLFICVIQSLIYIKHDNIERSDDHDLVACEVEEVQPRPQRWARRILQFCGSDGMLVKGSVACGRHYYLYVSLRV